MTQNKRKINVDLQSPIPITRQLAAWVRSEISAGILKPGDRLPSLRELAKATKISAPAVHAVFKQLEEEGLILQVHGKGSYVSDGTKGTPVTVPLRNTAHTAILLDYPTRKSKSVIPSPFALLIASEISQLLYEKNLPNQLYLPQVAENGTFHFPDLIQNLNQGIISGIVGATTLSLDILAKTEKAGIPVVMMCTHKGAPIRINVDFDALLDMGIDRLVAAGARRLALLGWSPAELRRGSRLQNLFEDKLHDRALPVEERWLKTEIEPWKDHSGWNAIQELWAAAPEKPDGLLFTDDILFQSAIPAIVQLRNSSAAPIHIVSHANKGQPISAPFLFDRLEIDPSILAKTILDEYVAALREGKRNSRQILIPPKLVPGTQCEQSLNLGSPVTEAPVTA